ncbi:palmitoyltransferase DHHC5 [Plasmodium brasilianum]|uniref:Palmitoyltransferase DHHC5 n=1 Tax=Plasmodium brasilianum TaxID=5824 RepID=A0ACB9Y552_PLABR|nr:palmitoyltransferase DHHC5 [Plasmodium brasilianum]
MNISHPVSAERVNTKEILFELVKRRDDNIYSILERDKNLINYQDENGNSLLHWAVFLNSTYLTCYLLENSKKKEIKNTLRNEYNLYMKNEGEKKEYIKSSNGQTPIFWAVCSNNVFMIYLLKNYGCNLYENDNKGYNCLTVSVQYNSILSFLYLLHLNFTITHKDFNNCSVLDWAAYNNNVFFLRLFSIFVNDFYSTNLTEPSSILHKAIIGNAYEAVVYLTLNSLQSIYDVGTDDSKTIIEFIDENKDKVDPRIYNFLKYKKIQQMSKKNNRKRINFLYESNGTIGLYKIKKKKNIRVQLAKKSIFLDVFHPLLFITYYFVVSSNPGYLENTQSAFYKGKNVEACEGKALLDGAEQGDGDVVLVRCQERQARLDKNGQHNKSNHAHNKKKEKKKGHNNNEQGKNCFAQMPNFIFEYIMKNIEEEIKLYEKKNKLIEFCKNVKYGNIVDLKKDLEIKWEVCAFEISSFDINMLCPTCFLFKNIRTKHCRYCDKCIDIFDHHCVFTLNCMGIDNSRIFLSWIVSNILFSFYTLYLYIWFFINYPINYEQFIFYVNLTVIILSLLLIYFMGSVFIRSVFNILENITSNEKFKMYSSNIFFTYHLKIDKNNEPIIVRKFKNPFDQGIYFNVLHFLTKSKENLTKKKVQYIQIDESVGSGPMRAFVEKLNAKLSELQTKKKKVKEYAPLGGEARRLVAVRKEGI